jgi:hypothetical protein
MRTMVRFALLAVAWMGNAEGIVAAEPAATLTAARRAHPNPRLKASYRLFSIAGLHGAPMWMQGGQLDGYFLSRRWIRAGFELEGGGGGAFVGSIAGADDIRASLHYGLAGLTTGIQYPARVTPFIEGRAVGGVLTGKLTGALTVGDDVYMGGMSATTWMWAGGLETGIELYVFRRAYLSVAAGWMRSTWHGVDVGAMLADPNGGRVYKNLVGDSFTLKVGLGI